MRLASKRERRRRAAGPPVNKARGRESGFGRGTSRLAERVSDDLRRDSDEFVRHRRSAARYMLVGAGALGLVSAYQLGLVKHLPDPPLPLLDSDTVDAAGEAYWSLNTPDATLGVASYGVTLALVGMGPSDRAEETPWIPLAAAAKATLDALGAVLLTAEQGSKQRAFCFYCLLAAGATLAAIPHVLPEARVAWRRLWSR